MKIQLQQAVCILLLMFAISTKAQQIIPCLTHEHEQEQRNNDPGYSIREAALEAFTQNFHPEEKSNATIIIPVVFHVLHEYGSENISKEQILDQLRTLNEDYKRTNPDTVNTPAPFKPLSGGLDIEFRLATIDPNGNCTDGINRLYTPLTNNARDNVKPLIYWPRNKYLNIWVVKSIENSSGSAGTVLGYAQFPSSGSASTDGLVVRSDYIGSIGTSNDGRTLTHEAGHWFNLRHIWGDATCGNDQVNDTPVHVGANSGCPPFPHLSPSCNQDANGDMFTNYMDYTNGTCMNQFSVGQCTRMLACLNSSTGQRNSLWTASNTSATGTAVLVTPSCAPVADYLPVLTQFICEGGSVTFTDKSYRALPTQYSWSFPGGTPSTSFSPNPTVTYTTPGTYTVTLTVSNANGSHTLTRNALIEVMPNTAQIQDTLLQSFESADIGSEGWEIINKVPGSVGFVSNNAGYVSGKCLWLNNFQEQATGSADELISPSYNLSVIDSPFISFRYAYAQKTTSTSSNRLQVYISTDCGKTWILRYNVSGNALGTVTATNASFTPANTTQWRTVNLSNITGFASSTNLRIRFLFTSGGDGNNFFLDHVRVSGRNTFASTEENNALQSSVYPNPANRILYVDAAQAITAYQVFDLSGRLLFSENAPQSMHQEIPISGLSKGIYILRLNHAKRSEQLRFVVQ